MKTTGDRAEDPDFALFQVESLSGRRDPRAAAPIHIFGRYPHETVQATAVEALAAIGSARSLTGLIEIAERGVSRAVRRAARQAADRLARRGVTAADWHPAEDTGPIHQVYVSSIDGAGSRFFRLIRKHPRQRPAFTEVLALVNTRVGLKDIFGAHGMTAAELRDSASVMGEGGTRICRVDPEYAGRLFRDALATTRAAGAMVPLEYCYWQDFLPTEWLEPEPYRANLDDLASPPSLSAAAEVLAGLPDLDGWIFEDPAVYDAADRLRDLTPPAVRAPGSRRRSRSHVPESSPERIEVQRIMAPLFDRLVRPELPDIARRLELTADLLRVEGQAAVVAAAHVARSLRELCDRRATDEDIARDPFLALMLVRSLMAAEANIQDGIDPRLDPDAFE